MADTQRTRGAILTLFADNVTGQISEQDLRDFVVTMMESEFVNPGDFWREPEGQYMSSDKTIKGWKMYSQLFSVAVSFGDIVMMTASGTWSTADVTGSRSEATMIGMAGATYAASTFGTVLRRGLAKDDAHSNLWSEIGKPYYITSGGAGAYAALSAALQSIYIYVGSPEPENSGATSAITDVFRFDPGAWNAAEDF